MPVDKLRSTSREAIARIAHAGLELNELFERAGHALRKAVPFDAACWHTLDPATLLETSHVVENLPFENPRASELEYLYEDFNQFAALARGARHSGILREATGGVPERSRRYRELIRPFGLQAELRGAFVTQGSAWGALGLLRDVRSPEFGAADAALLHRVSPHLAHGIRSALLRRAAADEARAGDRPGLVLLDAKLRLQALTPPAELLLAEISDSEPSRERRGGLPYVVYAVANRAMRAGRHGGREDPPAWARLRVRSGRWIELHGSRTSGEDGGQLAVILQEAAARTLSPLIAEAYGLTERERDVLPYLLRGASTKEIAAALGISPYTVQEHFKSLFEKFGVNRRLEMIGKVFFQYYQPAARSARR